MFMIIIKGSKRISQPSNGEEIINIVVMVKVRNCFSAIHSVASSDPVFAQIAAVKKTSPKKIGVKCWKRNDKWQG